MKVPKFKQGDIIRYGNEVRQVMYIYETQNGYDRYAYNLKIIQSAESGVGSTYDRGYESIDHWYTLDNGYLATKQFDKDLEDLLEE